MKPKTKVIKALGGYTVQFWIGNQGFTLNSVPEKEEAKFLKKMLDKAFERLEEETKKENAS